MGLLRKAGRPLYTVEANAAYAPISATTAWTTFTPGLSGTGWALGNGSITARYKQIGKTIFYFVNLSFGTTSTAGTGALIITGLPVTPTGSTSADTGFAFDGAAYYGVIADVTNTSQLLIRTIGQPGAFLTTSVPFTWGSLSQLRISGIYEAA